VFYLKRFEQIELQAKLLNYFLGSNKSNINQWKVASLCSSLFNTRRERGVLNGFPVLLLFQDLVDAYRNSRSAITMQREMDNIKSWPHGGSSVALAQKFFQDLFARERLTEQETRHELDSAH